MGGPVRYATAPSRSGPRLVVELVGLPGAGKSTVAAEAAKALVTMGVTCADRLQLGKPAGEAIAHYARMLTFYFARPAVTAAAFALARRPARSTWMVRLEEALRLYAWSYRIGRSRRLPCDVVVLDQGPVQAAWSLILHHRMDSAGIQEALTRIIGPPDSDTPYALVWVQVDPRVAAERIQSRETMESSFDHMTREQALRRLEAEGPQLLRLYQALAGALRLPTLQLDGTLSLAEERERLAGFITAELARQEAG